MLRRKALPLALFCMTLVPRQLTRTFAWLGPLATTSRTIQHYENQDFSQSLLCHYATTASQIEQYPMTSEQRWSLYMIRCGSNDSLYTGITTDVERRFEQHVAQSSKTAKYLRGKGPLELVFVADAGVTRSQASKLEHAVKSLPKARKEALLKGKISVDSLLVETTKHNDTGYQNFNNNDVAPMYITVGPPCSGKTEALRSHLLSVGYNPDDVFDRDVALGNQGGVYNRIPLVSFLFPSTRLHPLVGSQCLHGTTTVRDRLSDPAFLPTDQEMRNVLWRVAGRMTPREFATRCQAEQVRRAGGNVDDPYRRALAHDLVRATEEVVVQAIAEVICEMEFDSDEQLQMTRAALTPTAENCSSTIPDELPENKHKRVNEVPGRDTINATQANLLSARKLIGTSHIDLFVPQALFQNGIAKAQESLSKMIASSRCDQPVSWGNTNTRPTEFVAALAAAEEAGRPVEFIVWGSKRYPRVSRQELFRQSVSRLRRTGRYVPAGVIDASLGRVESLLQEAKLESENLFLQDDDHDTFESDSTGGGNDNCSSHKLNVALASLAGFYMDDRGFVTCVDEPKRIPNYSLGKIDTRQSTPR